MRTQVSQQPRLAALPLTVRKAVIIGCPHLGCRFTASALSEGRAIRAIGGHLVRVHWPVEEKRDADI